MPNKPNPFRLKQGPGVLTDLQLQDVIDRLENRIIILEEEQRVAKAERLRMDKRIRELEMHVRRLGRTSHTHKGLGYGR